MRRTATAATVIALLAAGCGDASAGTTVDERGELVVCDEITVIDRGDGASTRYFEAVYPGVAEGTATFTFCDPWFLNNGNYWEGDPTCTVGRNPFPGFYRDGDLHIACSVLDVSPGSSSETGSGRIYVRFDGEEAP